MNRLVLTREQSRAVDALAIELLGIPGMVLMENAGRGVVEALLEFDPSLEDRTAAEASVAILCGVGNNAGDGFVMARHLQILGVASRVLLLGEPARLRGDALQNYQILTQTGVELMDLSAESDIQAILTAQAGNANWYVDALLGTGASGSPREPFATAIHWLNAQSGKRLAVDVPSGLDCDTGEASPSTVQADLTCTFVAEKQGFHVPTATDYVGQLQVVSIGIGSRLLAELLAEN